MDWSGRKKTDKECEIVMRVRKKMPASRVEKQGAFRQVLGLSAPIEKRKLGG